MLRKTIPLLIMLILSIMINSCTNQAKEKIARKWHLKDAKIDSGNDTNPLPKDIAKGITDGLVSKKILYNFKNDGTFEVISELVPGRPTTGNWEVDKDAKVLSMSGSDDKTGSTKVNYKILELDATKLTIVNQIKDKRMFLYMETVR